VLEVWRGFRNIAYFLATLGFILLSFAIMFRVRLSPQTVVTAQTAIGKLIIVFLAITFSYALAALMVDLIFVVSFLIIALFQGAGLINAPIPDVQRELFTGNPLAILGTLLTMAEPAGDFVHKFVDQIIESTVVSGWFQNALQYIFGGTFDAIAQLIISIAIVFSLFRLLIQLILAYIEILILTVLGPLMILMDILPGGRGLSGWLKQLFANAMAFPTVTFMFLLGMVLVGGDKLEDRFGIPNAGVSLESGIQFPFLPATGDALRGFIGIGIVLMTPQAVKMVKDALKAESFFAKYTPAIGAAIGAGTARGISAPWQRATSGLRAQKEWAQRMTAQARVDPGDQTKPPKRGWMRHLPV
jgi:hypothetical protein